MQFCSLFFIFCTWNLSLNLRSIPIKGGFIWNFKRSFCIVLHLYTRYTPLSDIFRFLCPLNWLTLRDIVASLEIFKLRKGIARVCCYAPASSKAVLWKTDQDVALRMAALNEASFASYLVYISCNSSEWLLHREFLNFKNSFAALH